MFAKENKFIKKQCNIGKYETFFGSKTDKVSRKKNEDFYFPNSTLCQTNISFNPIHHSLSPLSYYSCKEETEFMQQANSERVKNEDNNWLISENRGNCNYLPTEEDAENFLMDMQDSFQNQPYVHDQYKENLTKDRDLNNEKVPFLLSNTMKMGDLDILPHKLSNTVSVSPAYMTDNNELVDQVHNSVHFPERSDKLKIISSDERMQNNHSISTMSDLRMGDLNEMNSTACAVTVEHHPSQSPIAFNSSIADQSNDESLTELQFISSSSTFAHPEFVNNSQLLPQSPSTNSKKVQFDLNSSTSYFHDLSPSTTVEVLSTCTEDNSISGPFEFLQKYVTNSKENVITTSYLPELLCSSQGSVGIEHFCRNDVSDHRVSFGTFDVINDPKEYSDVECEEDVLQSSLNRLSCDSYNLTPLGTSLRLLKLHRILQNKNDCERENMMDVYRCFSRWKKNARILKRIYNQQQEKMQRADLHYTKQLLNRHFYHWFLVIKIRTSLADAFYKQHMLSKGFSAFQWMMLKCRDRNEQLKNRRQQSMTFHLFYRWKERCSMNQRKRLLQYFSNWKRYYYCKILLSIFTEQRSGQTLIKHYKEWRERFQTRKRLNCAAVFYQTNLKRSILKTWLLYAADCAVQRSQKEMSFLQHRNRSHAKIILLWKSKTAKLMIAKKHNRKKVLLRCVTRWRTNAYYLKIHHTRQLRSCLLFREEMRLRQSWTVWRRRLVCIQLWKRRQEKITRSCFHRWKVEFEQKVFFHQLIASFTTKLLTRRCLRHWRDYVVTMKEKRNKASMLIGRADHRRVFSSWSRDFRQRKLLKQMVARLHESHNQRLLEETFVYWKSITHRVLVLRGIKRRKLEENARIVVFKWKELVEKRRLTRKCEELRGKCSRLSLEKMYSKWRTRREQEELKKRRADHHLAMMRKGRCRKLMREWHQLVEERKLVEPLLRKRRRRICSKFFDLWMGSVTKKRFFIQSHDEISGWKIARMFDLWKNKVHLRRKEKEVDQLYTSRLKMAVMSAWKKFAIRRMRTCQLRRRLCIGIVTTHLYQWRYRTHQRQLAAEEMFLKREEERRILSKSFKRWKSETRHWVATQREMQAYFQRNRTTSLQMNVMNRWKQSLTNQRLALHYNGLTRRKIKQICLHQWRTFTSSSLDEQSIAFSSSLRSMSMGDLVNDSYDQFPVSHESIINYHEWSQDHYFTTDSGLDLIRDQRSYYSDSNFSLPSALRRTESSSEGSGFEPGGSGSEVSQENSSLTYPRTLSSSVGGSLLTDLPLTDEEDEDESTIITQREVQPPLSPDDSMSATPSTKLFLEAVYQSPHRVAHPMLRPTEIVQVLTQGQHRLHVEKVIRYSLLRLSCPLVAMAFFQWKLLVHATKWKESSYAHARNRIENHKLKVCFCDWKQAYYEARCAVRHLTERRLKTAFQRWKIWKDCRLSLKRKQHHVTSLRNQSTVKCCFHLWFDNFTTQSNLNDILTRWHSIRSSRFDEQRRHSDVIQLREIFSLWKLKFRQLMKCDEYQQEMLRRKCFGHWLGYTEEQSAERRRISALHQHLEKKRFFHSWQRSLRLKEKLEQLRARAVKLWLISLLTRWQHCATGEHQRRDDYLALVRTNERSCLFKTFTTWKESLDQRRSATVIHHKLLLRSSFSLLRHNTSQSKMLRVGLKECERRRNEVLVTTSFRTWSRLCHLQVSLEQHSDERKRKIFKLWMERAEMKRADNLARHSLLQHCMAVWLNRYNATLKRKESVRKAARKWKAFSKEKSDLRCHADAFMTSKSRACKELIFNQWKIVYKQRLQVVTFSDVKLKSRFFQVWSEESRLKHWRKKMLVGRLVDREIASVKGAWERWRQQLAVSLHWKQITEDLNRHRLSRQQLVVWSLWKQRWTERKARKLYEGKIQTKFFLLWLQLSRSRSTLKKKVQVMKIIQDNRTISSSFITWSSVLRHNRIARHHFTMSIKRDALRRWYEWVARTVDTRENTSSWNQKRELSALKSCLRTWNDKLQTFQNMKFLADELLCKQQSINMKRYWNVWREKKEAIDLHIVTLQSRCVDKWRKFVRKQKHKRLLAEYETQVLLKNAFVKWNRLLKLNQHNRARRSHLLQSTLHQWQDRSALLTYASDQCRQQTIQKAWSAWRLRFALLRIDNETRDEIARDLLKRAFQAWRFLAARKKEDMKVPPQISRIPRMKRR